MTGTATSTGAKLAAIGAAAMVAAWAPAAEAATVPSGVVCSTYDTSASTASLRLATRNPGRDIETVAIGANNFFYPDLDDRGQPAQFLPGLQSWDFTVEANGRALWWGLNGSYLDLAPFRDPEALRFGRPCPERGPQITAVVPSALRAGVDGQRVTIFGQGLAGATATVRGDGVKAHAVAGTSAQRLDLIVDVDAGASSSPRDVLVTDPQQLQTGCRDCVALDAPALEPGPTGPTGPAGADAPRGESAPRVNATAAPAVIRATSAAVRVRGGKASATAVCPAGRSVVSGGHSVARATQLSVVTSRPLDARSWQVTVRAQRAGATARLRVYATCV